MSIPTDEQLKKMTPQERQNFIVDTLNKMGGDEAKSILKVYLLEKGEGIDVDFSKLPKLPDEVLMFNALVQNNDINLIKRYLDEEVMVGSDLDKELNRVFKTVGLTTDNLQGVGTTINLNKLLKCYYDGKMNNFSNDEIKIPIEIWLHDLSKNINETNNYLDVMNQDTKVCAKKMFDAWSEFDKLITRDLKSKNKLNFSERLRKLI